MVLKFRGYTIKHHEEGAPARLHTDIHAIQALGAVLNKREWWRKWKDLEIRTKWLREIYESLVALSVRHVAKQWPNLHSSLAASVFSSYLEICDNTTSDEATKQAKIDNALTHAVYPTASEQYGPFDEGHKYDSEDEEDDDVGYGYSDSNEYEASAIDTDFDMVYKDHRRKNPFGQLMWYTNVSLLRDQLRTFSVDRWTKRDDELVSDDEDDAEDDDDEPAPRRVDVAIDPAEMTCGNHLVRYCKLRENEPALRNAIVTIISAIRHEDCSVDFIRGIFPQEHRENVIKLLHFHLQKIRGSLDKTKLDITNVLDLIIKHAKLGHGEDQSLVPGCGRPGAAPHTWISDDLIDAELKTKFLKETAVLEKVPDDCKDWHPNSNDQVLNLVHPSLVCKVWRVTPMLKSRDALIQLPSTASAAEHMCKIMIAETTATLDGYKWLPCEVDVGGDARDRYSCEARIRTYINNLHPEKYTDMYDSIGSIFAKFVPLFDQMLSTLEMKDTETRVHHQTNTENAGEQCLAEKLKAVYPDATSSLRRLTPPGLFEWDHPSFTLKGSRCQVIVKIAQIVLTPDKPEYPGGTWHVEGTDSERIIGTGLYYYGYENITESHLSFRVACQEPGYEQSDHTGIGYAYGLEADTPLVQDLGSAIAMEDRCLVFPNTYQHKVEPFHLADPTKPGIRTILAFFLVDLTNGPVLSTDVVPPEQQEWIELATQPALKKLKLPDVVTQQIQDMMRTGMTLEQAKENRLKLMEDRMPEDYAENEDFLFSLCEH